MKVNLPGIFWLVLILALIPAVNAVIENFWPSSQYYVSAIVIAVLGALAKAIQVMLERSAKSADGIDITLPGDAEPAASMRIEAQPEQPGTLTRLLFG